MPGVMKNCWLFQLLKEENLMKKNLQEQSIQQHANCMSQSMEEEFKEQHLTIWVKTLPRCLMSGFWTKMTTNNM